MMILKLILGIVLACVIALAIVVSKVKSIPKGPRARIVLSILFLALLFYVNAWFANYIVLAVSVVVGIALIVYATRTFKGQKQAIMSYPKSEHELLTIKCYEVFLQFWDGKIGLNVYEARALRDFCRESNFIRRKWDDSLAHNFYHEKPLRLPQSELDKFLNDLKNRKVKSD